MAVTILKTTIIKKRMVQKPIITTNNKTMKRIIIGIGIAVLISIGVNAYQNRNVVGMLIVTPVEAASSTRASYVWWNTSISGQSKTTSRIITRRKNRSHFRNFIGRGDGMNWGIASKYNTREYGNVGGYQRHDGRNNQR